ncbi:response regulator (plasmid) [Sinorhizobium meliloti]|nr:response regulator [Sinorhizobium meliloti]WKL24082.1 response regulator [Sinorhizobium meliloti]WKL27949.1 response regulator [Sinorhizobium meliloti]WKL33514.1 response regulator [Sinorhizobium meliloti]WKL39351.1 response regulator [Sinorhizobium meliloti]
MLFASAPERRHLVSPPRKVAVVEDDASVRRSVERLLTVNGFATEGYSSAEAFLSRANVSQIGCVVLDMHLGGKSGIELLHRLRAFGINLSVIFITAVEDERLELEAVKAGCVAFLHKPFPAFMLISAVNKALMVSPDD